MGASIRDGIVALARVIGAFCGHDADLLLRRGLAEQIRQHRCVADVVPADRDRPDLQCLLVDPEVDLAPDAPFGATMLARMPLPFALNLDPGAVDQQVLWASGAAIGDVHGEGLLAM